MIIVMHAYLFKDANNTNIKIIFKNSLFEKYITKKNNTYTSK